MTSRLWTGACDIYPSLSPRPPAGVRGARLRGGVHQLRAALHVAGAALAGARPHRRRVGGRVRPARAHAAGAEADAHPGGAQRALLDPQGHRLARVQGAPAAAQEGQCRPPDGGRGRSRGVAGSGEKVGSERRDLGREL